MVMFDKDFQKSYDKVKRGIKAIEQAGLQNSSAAYQKIKEYIATQPNARGVPYNISDDGKITLKSFKEYSNLSNEQKKMFIESVTKASQLKTINKRGTTKAQNDAFRHFKEQLDTATTKVWYDDDGKKHKERPYKDLTKTEYSKMWKAFHKFAEDKGSKYVSDLINGFEDEYALNMHDILEVGNEEKLYEFLNYYEMGRADLITSGMKKLLGG